MVYTLARPILFRLDAERAHEVGLGIAKRLAARAEVCEFVHDVVTRPSSSPRIVAGMNFDNPIGLAAGLDKNAEAAMAWWAFGFGFVELGTVTPRPQTGKARPRLFRDVRRQALINRMGFNNHGADVVAARLSAQHRLGLRPPMPIGISVGKNATTPNEQAADDYALATRKLAPYADFITINVSSPNTPGLRSLQDPRELSGLIRATKEAAGGKPVFVKVAPELAGDALRLTLDTCLDAGVAGMIATNTLARQPDEDREEGGLSGQPLREIAPARVAFIRRHVGNKIAVIGCGGVNDAESARNMLDAGANLVQLYTGLVYGGPFLPAKLSRAVG